jgi:hypothetical protein
MHVHEQITKDVPTAVTPPISGLIRAEITRVHSEMKEGIKCNAIGKR